MSFWRLGVAARRPRCLAREGISQKAHEMPFLMLPTLEQHSPTAYIFLKFTRFHPEMEGAHA